MSLLRRSAAFVRVRSADKAHSFTKVSVKAFVSRVFGVVYMFIILPASLRVVCFPAVLLQINNKLAVHNLDSKFSRCLLTSRFMYFLFRSLLVSLPALSVVVRECKLDVITYLQMKHMCAFPKECYFFSLVAMVTMSRLTSM